MTPSPSRHSSLAVCVLLVLAGSTACKTYRTTAPSEITPQNQIEVRFSSPTTLRVACDSATRAASGCVNDTATVAGVVELWGRFQREDGDSILVRIAEVRNASRETVRYQGSQSVWLHAQSAVIGERHTSTVRTVVLVFALAASVVAIAAIGTIASGGPSVY